MSDANDGNGIFEKPVFLFGQWAKCTAHPAPVLTLVDEKTRVYRCCACGNPAHPGFLVSEQTAALIRADDIYRDTVQSMKSARAARLEAEARARRTGTEG